MSKPLLTDASPILFGATTPQDAIDRLRRDYNRFCFAKTEQDRTDFCFHFASTAHHMPEWFVDVPSFSGKTSKQIRSATDQECPEMALMAEIANGSKHRYVDRQPIRHTAFVSAAIDRTIPEPQSIITDGTSCVYQPVAIGVAPLEHKAKFPDGSVEKIKAIFIRVLTYWESKL